MGGDFITFKYRYRKQIILGVILFLIISTITTYLIINYKPKEKSENKILVSKKETKEEKEEPVELLKVDIKGQVANPGIYTVSKSSRVIDVIELSGGLTTNANTSVINLSKKVTDEMVIIIYSNEEVSDFKKTKELEQQVQEHCIQKDENSLINDACITTDTNTSSRISINNATVKELQNLPGIGESKAKDIVSYREQNGPFKSLEDLKNVSGIGDALFAKIKDYITL